MTVQGPRIGFNWPENVALKFYVPEEEKIEIKTILGIWKSIEIKLTLSLYFQITTAHIAWLKIVSALANMETDDAPLLTLDPISEDVQYPQFLHGIWINDPQQQSNSEVEVVDELQRASSLKSNFSQEPPFQLSQPLSVKFSLKYISPSRSKPRPSGTTARTFPFGQSSGMHCQQTRTGCCCQQAQAAAQSAVSLSS